MKDRKRKRGIYLLPNLFTTAVLFSGFFAILAAVDGHFEKSAIAIIVALLMDGLDGRLARLTHTQTAFGAEYDSLSDMVAFGVAPGLLVYHWSLQGLGRIGWFVSFIYVAGVALRLARFNTQLTTSDKRYFQGLPSPAGATLLACCVWTFVDFDWSAEFLRYPVGALTLLTGIFMISNMRYLSFKEIDFHGKVPFVVLIAIALVAAIIVSDPAVVLFVLFLGYMLSGLLLTLKQGRVPSFAEEPHDIELDQSSKT